MERKANKKRITVFIARAGVISALYIVLSFITFPVSGGAIQFRLGESLTLLPLVLIESVPALAVGCLCFNFILGLPLLDVLLGTAITLVSALLTHFVCLVIKIKWLKILVGGIFPVMLNATLLPLIWIYCYGVSEYVYMVQALLIMAGEGLAVYLVGTPVYLAIDRFIKRGII